MTRSRLLTSLSLAVALSPALAAAAPVDPVFFGGLQWRLIGPFRGGRVLAAAGVPGEANHFYFGAVNGGVWETHDAGRTWTPIFDDQPVGSIGALAIAPSEPRTIYVGTGEADMRSDISQGDGMFRSTDGGKTWQAIGLADSQQIARIIVDPDDAKRLFVAALGHPYGPNAERGVFRSTDGGGSWQKVLGSDDDSGDDTGAVDVAFDPRDPRILFAALWQTRRTPWSVYPPSNGPGSGIFRSTDGGDHWTSIGGHGFPAAHGRVGFALPARTPGRVYAIVDAEPGGGLYRSDDDGASWRRTSADSRIWGRGWYFGRITVDPVDPDRIFALNTLLLESKDGGSTFVPVRGDETGDDFHDLWIDPTNPKSRILATDQGTLVSVNGGTTWSSWHNQPTAQIYRLSTDDRFPYWVYGAQQDSGAVGLPSRTGDGDGITVRDFKEVTAGGEADNVVPDPRDPQVLFGGRVDRLDLRTQQTRNIDPTLAYPGHHRRTWTLPLAFSRRQPGVLYFANQHLYRTDDDGEHWARISPDLTYEDPGIPPNLDPTTAVLDPGLGPRKGVIYAIAPSRTADRDLWVGTDDGRVWRTRDEGESWQEVTPPGLEPWSKIGTIETSPFDSETAYLAVDRHRLDNFRPYVYRTHDGGAHWTLVTSGIGERHAVNAVREDPKRRGLLYAGTERGVYVSFDDGDAWQPLQLDLPVTSVRDLEVKGDDLVIATHGRGFWVLDDVSPLRQLPLASNDEPFLFAPSTAVRVRPAGFTGTPFPPEEPKSANPRFGAVIDYYLPTAAESLSLAIRDEAGNLVRDYHLRGPEEIDPADLKSSPDWVVPPERLDPAPGAHRFVWSLRRPAPTALAGGDPDADGVWLPPGRYRIELVVGERIFERTLEVRADPRVPLPPEAYAAQYRLALEIESLADQVAAAKTEAGELQKALTARLAVATPQSRPLLEAFQAELIEATGVVPAENASNAWWRQARSLESLRSLASALEALMQAVDGADAAPSADAARGVELVRPRVAAGLAAWAGLAGEGHKALDEELVAVGEAPVEPR